MTEKRYIVEDRYSDKRVAEVVGEVGPKVVRLKNTCLELGCRSRLAVEEWQRLATTEQEAREKHVELCKERLRAAYESVAARQRELDEALSFLCPMCGGEGGIDSGGETPWGSPVTIPCPSCKPSEC